MAFSLFLTLFGVSFLFFSLLRFLGFFISLCVEWNGSSLVEVICFVENDVLGEVKFDERLIIEEGFVFQILFFIGRVVIANFLAAVFDTGMDNVRNRKIAHFLFNSLLSVVNVGSDYVEALDEKHGV